ncbi:MAG: nitroreductase family protein [Methanoregulaceae archaeon]|nr:nitroreductase family protein [Methanoregulaceae archaeon]
MEFINLVMARYATKKFDGRRIDGVRIAQLFEMIRYAPSAVNLQPWKIKVVTDPGLKAQLRTHSNDQEQITSCSHLLVFCADTNLPGLVEALGRTMKKFGAKEEETAGLVGFAKGWVDGMTKEQMRQVAQQNVFLALSHAILGAKALGFDSCPMAGFDPEGYAKVLGLPDNLIPTVLCPVGYAADTQPTKIRFPKEDVFI